jgi:hypothetical protein
MDYLLFRSLLFSVFAALILSYDIVCQWYKNLWKRMATYPNPLQMTNRNGVAVKFLVPKFHLPAHIDLCQMEFSFNLTKGVGRTDGEGVERGWANIDKMAPATKEMGPGLRRDTLDDHFGDSNWKKLIALGMRADHTSMTLAHSFFTGTTLLRKLKEASPEANDHTEALEDFEASLHNASNDIISWKAEVQLWEADNTNPNPYKSRVSGTL